MRVNGLKIKRPETGVNAVEAPGLVIYEQENRLEINVIREDGGVKEYVLDLNGGTPTLVSEQSLDPIPSEQGSPEKCCGNCEHWERQKGQCRVDGPRHAKHPQWPETNRNDFCGKFQVCGGEVVELIDILEVLKHMDSRADVRAVLT